MTETEKPKGRLSDSEAVWFDEDGARHVEMEILEKSWSQRRESARDGRDR